MSAARLARLALELDELIDTFEGGVEPKAFWTLESATVHIELTAARLRLILGRQSVAVDFAVAA